MDVGDLDVAFFEVIGEILGHTFGERGDQGALVLGDAAVNFLHQVINLALGGAHFNFRVQEAGGADDLFGGFGRVGEFVFARGGGDIDGLVNVLLELGKGERAIVQGAGEPEAVFHQSGFPGVVAVIHTADLGQGHMRFVH